MPGTAIETTELLLGATRAVLPELCCPRKGYGRRRTIPAEASELDQVSAFFVYGTLKQGQSNAYLLAPFVASVETATVNGRLYDVGEFPALIEGQGRVHGQLVTLDDGSWAQVLAIVDRLEGFIEDDPDSSMYIRRLVTARTADKSVKAYAYFYNRRHPAMLPIDRLQYLEEGHWNGPRMIDYPIGSDQLEEFRIHVREFGRSRRMDMPTIAVVNDDTTFLTLMAELIKDRGWESLICREAGMAYETLKAAHPDVVVLDIRMGNPEAGWTILELLTLDPETRGIPVIVCSAAVVDLRSKEDWLEDRGISVLQKPFDLDDLYEHIDQALKKSGSTAGDTLSMQEG